MVIFWTCLLKKCKSGIIIVSIRNGLDTAVSAASEKSILRQLEDLRKELETRFSSEISLELGSYDEN